MAESPKDARVEPVRCYACGHQYGAVPNRIDTACPKCGSDSYSRLLPGGGDSRG